MSGPEPQRCLVAWLRSRVSTILVEVTMTQCWPGSTPPRSPSPSPSPSYVRPGQVPRSGSRLGPGREVVSWTAPSLLLFLESSPSLHFPWKPSDGESWNLDVFPAFGLLIKTNKSATWSQVEGKEGRGRGGWGNSGMGSPLPLGDFPFQPAS